MNFESPEKSKKPNTLEASVFATALLASLGSLDSHPAQALEILPHTSWQTGIQDNLRKSVIEDKTERATTYVAFTDGTGTWLSPTVGKSADKVTIDVEKFNSQIMAISGNKKVSVTCHIHTHPSEAYRNQFKVPGEAEKIPGPPSETDIIAAGLAMNNLTAGDGSSRPMQFAAADAQHIWYFSKVRDQKVDLKRFNQAYGDFILRSIKQNFIFERELPKLQSAYRDYLGGEVRAVTYKSLQNEAPCAGIDTKQGGSSK